MTNLDNEMLVRYLVVLDRPGRQFTAADDTRWGGLLSPNPEEIPTRGGSGLKVVLLGSWLFGYLVLETLERYERRFPGKLNFVGLVTDDPLNPDARISVKKRIWNLVGLPYRVIDETSVIESGLSHGVPVYTGEVKVESFRKLLGQWNPDAILVCVFGQIIDAPMIEVPRFGTYNFHPSDLSLHQGAGPAPYDDLAARRAGTTRWSVHHVTEEVDAGPVVGHSPLVNVLNAKGALPGDPLVVYEKLSEALGPLAFFLIEELCRRHETKRPGPIEEIDFENRFSGEVKSRLLQPILKETADGTLPIPESSLFA